MIISSWNVNSIRARILNVQEYLKKFNPDIVLTQEIKTQEETYPFDDIKKLKYESYVFGQKSYNGVAILSKKKLDKIEKDIFKDKNKQSRIITADAKYKSKTIKIINIYTPNGNPVDTEKYDYKLYWLDSLIKKLKSLLKSYDNIIIAGDFNIIPSAEDVHDPKGYENDALFRIEIRKKLREMFNLGFHDAFRYIYPDKEEYTFWDYTSGAWQKNNGMRIDHFLVSNSMIDQIKTEHQEISVNNKPLNDKNSLAVKQLWKMGRFDIIEKWIAIAKNHVNNHQYGVTWDKNFCHHALLSWLIDIDSLESLNKSEFHNMLFSNKSIK